MQILIVQAIDLARKSQQITSMGMNLAQAAQILLIAGQPDQAIPLLGDAIESLRFSKHGEIRMDVLENIIQAFNACPREILIQLFPQLLHATLEAEGLLFEGISLVLPFLWRVSIIDVPETIRVLIREVEASAHVMQEVFMG